MKRTGLLLAIILFSALTNLKAQQSVAREWNEALLTAIRVDIARPTVHARNLFHSSMAMYDAWAVFDSTAETVFLGKTFGGYTCEFNGIATPSNVEEARHEIISYAMYRLLNHRFSNSPGVDESLATFDTLFSSLGYDANFVDTDYSSGSYAALGNYLAQEIINFGLQDGANEQNLYANQYYTPVNEALILENYDETNELDDPNRWQPLAFEVFIGQAGNEFPGGVPDFLSPEWGEVTPFSLEKSNLEIINNGFDSYVYNDPGPPVYIQESNEDGIDDPYKWHFALVASWSAHLDPSDATLIDISPGAIGNVDIEDYPETFTEYQLFYDFDQGGDPGTGHALNPVTNAPYTPQMVKRADYARVLAEFWADGPDSETPPGHWFTILNYVNDHPEISKQFGGQGPVLSDLEWDVKAYLAMGGAMHDAAINTWGIKGYYDYIRPISAVRYMAGKGQSSDAGLPSYDPHGLPLIPGLIELVEVGDPLAGADDENVGRIKIFAWKGPDFIIDPEADIAGVDWILGTHWWPYQRSTFVTPPFAGYLSGHSTYSRAAAEVLTLFTGDAFFPGGMGVFEAAQEDFLVFENGPSESITLQWATYRDASDQTSLSRIWGGIHPPIDDIKGRIIGDKIGKKAFNLARDYFDGIAIVESDNFQITTSSETCVDQNDGSITISPKSYFSYTASVNGQVYPFTDELMVEDLAPGTYNLCITIDSDGNFEQCFTFEITEASPINASIEIVDGGVFSKARININGGTPPFVAVVNDAVVHEFDEHNFEVDVEHGDVLKIQTNLACEGKISEQIALPGQAPVMYPNPSTSVSSIYIPEDISEVMGDVFNAQGQLMSSKMYVVTNHKIELNAHELPVGVYYVVLNLGRGQTFKLIKK